jgi:DNA-directed RNA polymerase subunit RPC12/RpoP
MEMTIDPLFTAAGDQDCKHRSHYECMACRKLVCARCGAELAMSTINWKAIGYWCDGCLRRETESP